MKRKLLNRLYRKLYDVERKIDEIQRREDYPATCSSSICQAPDSVEYEKDQVALIYLQDQKAFLDDMIDCILSEE